MYRDKAKFGQDPTLVVRSKGKFYEPLKWKDGRLIFTCSWSDWFIDEADAWREDAYGVIRQTPQHIYQILTKRTELIPGRLPGDWKGGYRNVWLGQSIEDQPALDKRLHLFTRIPAYVRFLSCEPLLGPLDFKGRLVGGMGDFGTDDIVTVSPLIHQVIIGGESGNDNGEFRYRPCDLDWIKNVIDQCRAACVPVFVKQLGTHLAKKFKLKHRHGGDMDEWPYDWLKVREYPFAVNDLIMQHQNGHE